MLGDVHVPHGAKCELGDVPIDAQARLDLTPMTLTNFTGAKVRNNRVTVKVEPNIAQACNEWGKLLGGSREICKSQ